MKTNPETYPLFIISFSFSFSLFLYIKKENKKSLLFRNGKKKGKRNRYSEKTLHRNPQSFFIYFFILFVNTTCSY
jgi:hypothetical protein